MAAENVHWGQDRQTGGESPSISPLSSTGQLRSPHKWELRSSWLPIHFVWSSLTGQVRSRFASALDLFTLFLCHPSSSSSLWPAIHYWNPSGQTNPGSCWDCIAVRNDDLPAIILGNRLWSLTLILQVHPPSPLAIATFAAATSDSRWSRWWQCLMSFISLQGRFAVFV